MLQREGWVEEFVGWEGLGEHESGAPALEGGGGEADYYLGVGVSWGGSRCEPARGGKKGGVCVCVCVCVCVSGWWWLTPGDEAGDEDVLRPRAEAQNSVQLSA